MGRCRARTISPDVAVNDVWPSGAAFATRSVAIVAPSGAIRPGYH
jgi:hypothetical protein